MNEFIRRDLLEFFVYEVNLSVDIDIFNKNREWLLNHFHEMVYKNGFDSLNLLFIENVDPINDSFIRKQEIVAQYYISDFSVLSDYLKKQSLKMRSEVYERLGNKYSISRRVLKVVDRFINTAEYVSNVG